MVVEGRADSLGGRSPSLPGESTIFDVKGFVHGETAGNGLMVSGGDNGLEVLIQGGEEMDFAMFVEFGSDVIQEEDRCLAGKVVHEVNFREPDGDDGGALLTLGSVGARVVFIDENLEIITVRADGGLCAVEVAFAAFAQALGIGEHCLLSRKFAAGFKKVLIREFEVFLFLG